jgi:hypothetical protein
MDYRIVAISKTTAVVLDEAGATVASGPIWAMSASYRLLSEHPFVPMAEGLFVFNGSGTPCDMLNGPCSCGATHQDGDNVKREI